MSLIACIHVALRGLASNKMRTTLTMLGMIIGVGVVIIVVGIGEGAKKRVTDAVNSMGNNLLNVTTDRNKLRVGTAGFRSTAAATPTNNAAANSTPVNTLKLEDAELIAKVCSTTVETIAPQIDNQLQVRLGDVDTTTEVAGTSIEYLYVKNTDIASGRFFTQSEVDGLQKVCVVGPTVAENLCGSPTDLTGRMLAISHQQFKVVGMLAAKGAAAGGQDQDDVILIPISTAERRVLNSQALNNILIRCKTTASMPLAQEQVAVFLRSRHHLMPPFPDNDDFRIRNQQELLEAQQNITGTMTTMLSMAAVISLIVGGIGIMNIMLVSVTERTREIGIRKAVGATPRDILLQFLIEATTISLLGGVIGILFGVGGAGILSDLAGWQTIVNTSAITAAVIVSAGVGIFFGIYPSSKAARLHPIDALRYE